MLGIWEKVAKDSLSFHVGMPCPTFLCPASRLPSEMALWLFQGRPCRVGGIQPSSSFLDTPRCSSMLRTDIFGFSFSFDSSGTTLRYDRTTDFLITPRVDAMIRQALRG
jgi:hypothetical protein